MGTAVMFADTQAGIGWTIAIVILIAFGIGVFLNMRKARAEVGSEIELAANRNSYIDDEELETSRLDRTLLLGLLFLGFIAVALPVYWLYEPARQEGAIEDFEKTFVARGQEIYDVTAKCIECHGPKGVGGAKDFTILNDNGEFVASVAWQAPSLDNVLYRYSREQVLFILEYGRPFSPMSAWGAKGGGPLTEQQLENTVDYLQSIQLPAATSTEALDKEIEKVCKPETSAAGSSVDVNPRCTVNDPASPNGERSWNTLGEALFNLGYYDGFAGGSYSCGRCHTKGWSYAKAEVPGGGALGPNLTGGSTLRQFETAASQVDFVAKGAAQGKPYGRNGLSSGKMPAFGVNPNVEEPAPNLPNFGLQPSQTMYTTAQIDAIVAYERGL
jgi:mono/diheme cytochrome c family protein